MRAFSLLQGVALLAALFAHAEDTLRVDLGGGQMLELVHIEPGTFQQGSPSGEVGAARMKRRATSHSRARFFSENIR